MYMVQGSGFAFQEVLEIPYLHCGPWWLQGKKDFPSAMFV